MKRKVITNILLIFFSLVFVISLISILQEVSARKHASSYADALRDKYIPTIPSYADTDIKHAGDDTAGDTDNALQDTSNPTIQKLIEEYPDVIGWLTVDGASISYPFVQGKDNSSYLWADLDGNYISGGTIFMDYRNSRDFTDSLTIIYGHNMLDDSMFGKLANYLDFNYLLDNSDVYISFPEYTAHYTAVACLVADGSDNIIFDNIATTGNIQDVVDFIYRTTDINPDVSISGDSKLLVLSTCNKDFDTARTLLICIPD